MKQEIEKVDRILSSVLFRRVLPAVILALYAAGLVMMIISKLGQGLSLWFLSTVIGGIQLFTKRTLEDKKAGIEQMMAEERARREAEDQEEKSE